MKLIISLVIGSMLLFAAFASEAATPQGVALMQTPAANPFNIGGGVVAGPHGTLFGTVGDSLYAVTPPANGGNWTPTVIGRAWSTGLGTVADGFAFAEGKVAVDSKGVIYAATSLGGESGGAVLRFAPSTTSPGTWSKSILWNLPAGTGGASINAGLTVDPAGNVYVTTRGGRGLACFPDCRFGAVYQLSPPTGSGANWTATMIHRFGGDADGENPDGTLTFDNSGRLLGTAQAGANNAGLVFRLTPPHGAWTGWEKDDLYVFTGGADGRAPIGGVVADSQGALYGETSGCAGVTPCNNVGSVYRLGHPAVVTQAWSLTTIAGPVPFPGYRGNLVVDAHGTLFGSVGYQCSVVGVSCGAVFSLTAPAKGTSAWTYTQLIDTALAGAPAGLVAANGMLFSAANEGAGCTALGGCLTVLAMTNTGYTP